MPFHWLTPLGSLSQPAGETKWKRGRCGSASARATSSSCGTVASGWVSSVMRKPLLLRWVGFAPERGRRQRPAAGRGGSAPSAGWRDRPPGAARVRRRSSAAAGRRRKRTTSIPSPPARSSARSDGIVGSGAGGVRDGRYQQPGVGVGRVGQEVQRFALLHEFAGEHDRRCGPRGSAPRRGRG